MTGKKYYLPIAKFYNLSKNRDKEFFKKMKDIMGKSISTTLLVLGYILLLSIVIIFCVYTMKHNKNINDKVESNLFELTKKGLEYHDDALYLNHDTLLLLDCEDLIPLTSVLSKIDNQYDFISLHHYNKFLRNNIITGYPVSEPIVTYESEPNAFIYNYRRLLSSFSEYSNKGIHFSSNLRKFIPISKVERYSSTEVQIQLNINGVMESVYVKVDNTPNVMLVTKLLRLIDNKQFYYVNIVCPQKSTIDSNLMEKSNYLWILQALNTLVSRYTDAPFFIVGTFNVHGFEDVFKKYNNQFHIGDFKNLPTRRHALVSTDGFLISKELYSRIEYHTDIPFVQSYDRFSIHAKLYINSKNPGIYISKQWPVKKLVRYINVTLPTQENSLFSFNNNLLGRSSNLDSLLREYPSDKFQITNMGEPEIVVGSIDATNGRTQFSPYFSVLVQPPPPTKLKPSNVNVNVQPNVETTTNLYPSLDIMKPQPSAPREQSNVNNLPSPQKHNKNKVKPGELLTNESN